MEPRQTPALRFYRAFILIMVIQLRVTMTRATSAARVSTDVTTKPEPPATMTVATSSKSAKPALTTSAETTATMTPGTASKSVTTDGITSAEGEKCEHGKK